MTIKEKIKNTPSLLMFYGILESLYKTCLKETKNKAEAREDIRAFVETILDELSEVDLDSVNSFEGL